MTGFIRHTLAAAALLLLALTAGPHPTAAQPWAPRDGGNPYGGTPGMHLFLPSRFIESIRRDRLTMARIRNYREAYRKAADSGAYDRALAYANSLVHMAEYHRIPGVTFTGGYLKRARMLHLLQRDAEACATFDRAVAVQDSVMHLEQRQTLREMQSSYELDRLELDKALLTAHHHKRALISLALLISAIGAGIGFIYAGNRRTQRLQRELLQQMQQVHESEVKKADFINSICHEVRTPLNSITGFSELLSTEEVLPEAHAQYCEIIQESRRQLRYLFDDLLEVSYLESLAEPLQRDYLDICALCRTQLRVMKVRYPKAGVAYADGIPVEPIAAISSEKYLTILLMALLGNAQKFTRQGEVRLECSRDEEHFSITVTDTGCGIPSEQYDHVFERFTKLDTFSQGNGLGLYLCRLIVRHLGGEIRIDPEYTEGTRIVVVLPRK